MKIVIVTGASSGMGREAAIQLADRFSGIGEIWAVARRAKRLEELKEQVPVPVRVFPLDLSLEADRNVLAQALKEEQPEVRMLVNAAGYGKIGAAGDIPLEEETGMVRLNCEALCAVTHMVLPYMPKNSRVIQLASSAAFMPQPGFAVYAATKAFVLSYSRALNAELKKRGILVTAVCPGPVKTEFFDVAETTGKMPFYKELTMARAENVVRKALRDSMMGKEVSIYGLPMNAFFVLTKILPHRLLIQIAGKL
ncbi:MAG TPA: SDR family NAD(P)-dependent oxidoreductase [Candidatus Ventrimonas merdavium]|nr:SDR family NAD(P)-dependent oxidoreductase [Candidatus Ventrimonas merdavium]